MRDTRLEVALLRAKDTMPIEPPALVQACLRWLEDCDEDETFADADAWELDYYTERWRHFNATNYAKGAHARAHSSQANPSFSAVVASKTIDII